MKKRWSIFFLAFILLGGMLLASSGDSQKARAAAASLPTAKGVLISMARPPAKMCVGEQAVVSAGALSLVPARGTHITATASGGTLTKMDWRYPNGWVGGKLLRTTFKATEAGKARIIFQMEEGGTNPLPYPFEIVDCMYDLNISGLETTYTDTASFQYAIAGDSVINGSKDNDRLSGSGTYTVTFSFEYKFKNEGVTCASTAPSKGESSFTVTGNRSGTVLKLSLEFKPVELSGASIKCVDKNGRETEQKKMPPVLEGKSDTQNYLLLSGITVTPGVGLKFNFSKSGRGYLTVTSRSQS
jgi:hypothetical protein